MTLVVVDSSEGVYGWEEPRPRVAAGVELPCTSEVRVLVWRRPRDLKKRNAYDVIGSKLHEVK